MKSLFVILGLLFVLIVSGYGQTTDNTITYKKKVYYQSGKAITTEELKKLLENNPNSAVEYQKAMKIGKIAAPVMLGGAAAALVGAGINLASSISGSAGTDGLGLALLGATVEIIAIPVVIIGSRHLKKSITQYNSSVKGMSYEPVKFNLMANNNGIGIRVTF